MPMKSRRSYFLVLLLAASLQMAPHTRAAESVTILSWPVNDNAMHTHLEQLQQAFGGHDIGKIRIKPVRFWNNFQSDLREGKRGIYLAPPHFAAWAINKHGFRPLLRAPDPLKYVIAVNRSDSHLFEINDLDQQRVCAQKPLNLDYLLINAAFDEPMHWAEIVTVRSVHKEMLANDTRCVGFALSNHLYKQLENQYPDRFIRLQQGAEFNNYVLVSHPDIDDSLLLKMMQLLQQSRMQKHLLPLLRPYADSGQLIRAKVEDYPLTYTLDLTPYWAD